MEQLNEFLKSIGKALLWVVEKLFKITGAILQAIGKSMMDNSKH